MRVYFLTFPPALTPPAPPQAFDSRPRGRHATVIPVLHPAGRKIFWDHFSKSLVTIQVKPGLQPGSKMAEN